MEMYKSIKDPKVQNVIRNHSEVKHFPSPIAWEDQVLYFMMLDRFSDGKEDGFEDINGVTVKGETPLFSQQDNSNAIGTEKASQKWREAGTKWCGGTLNGLRSKLGYLKRLGVTAIWVSPVFRQIPKTTNEETYHGYGIQNYLDIDPNFGTREDLKELVEDAHKHGIYVIMDIILNHAGNIFSYNYDRMYWHNGQKYDVKGFNDEKGEPVINFEFPVPDKYYNKGAVWPQEFQTPNTFTREGEIRDWDHDPEYYDGDFCNLKDIVLGNGNMLHYAVGDALKNLIEVYKYWISYADIDGFRVDTVKHMDKGATRFFASAIHEYAQSIGKENFYLIGEITGGRGNAFKTMEETGLDAALGINEIPGKIEGVVKGEISPSEYFELFRHSLQLGKDSHAWFRDKVVSMFDDHDQVRKGEDKARFCADRDGEKLIAAGMALNLLTEGIPCIYYGTEQYLDGNGGNDRYLRECMFGGAFGPFRSSNRHVFNEKTKIYQQIMSMTDLRKRYIELRRGRQYLRQISGNGFDFSYPQKLAGRMSTVIAWSRIFNNNEILIAINTNAHESLSAWVTIDDYLHNSGDKLKCLYATELSYYGDIEVEARNGKSVNVSVPPGGVVIFNRE